MIETHVQDHTIHITGYFNADAYEPLKEALSQVSDKVVLSFDEKCFINSTAHPVVVGEPGGSYFAQQRSHRAVFLFTGGVSCPTMFRKYSRLFRAITRP